MLLFADPTPVSQRVEISSCSCAVAVTDPFTLLLCPCCGSVV
ncbi:hypothetical protein OAL13_01550 [bacterium]|nr:hypothetical protein [bacterium]